MSPDRRRSWILVLCCLGQFMVVLDVSIVNVALPAISTGLSFEAADLHWVVNAYSITYGGFLLLGGRAADIVGRREMFVGGLSLLVVGSLLGGLAQNKEMLVLARAIQGLGAAAASPATLTILMTTFVEGAERNRALGLWAATGSIGGMLGGLIGGVLTDALSWRWVLLINVPVAIGLIVGALLTMERRARADRPAHTADIAGAVTITSAMVALTFGIVGTQDHAWLSLNVLGLLLLSALLLVSFLVIEARLATEPLVPLRVFRSRSLSGAVAAALCLGFAGISMWYLVSLYSQNVLGYSAFEAGLVMVGPSILLALAARIAGKLCNRFAPGPVLAFGMGVLALGMLGMTQISAHGNFVNDLLVPTSVIAIGLGFSYVPVTISASTGVVESETGLASGLLNAGRQIGGSIGIALLSTVAASQTASLAGEPTLVALTSGYAHAFAFGAAVALLGAAIALVVLNRRRVTSEPIPVA